MKWFFHILGRITCSHDIYILSPENPGWAKCAVCGKTKRI